MSIAYETGFFARFSILVIMAMLLCSCSSPEERAAGYRDAAQAHFDDGNLVEAKLELRNALQIEPKNAGARYLLALINERDEDYAQVLGNLMIAIESDPDYLDARLKLGYFYTLGQQADKAQEQADAALRIAPDDAAVRLLNARVLYLTGNAEEALEEARASLASDPSSREAINFVAALQTAAGRFDAALATIDQGIRDVEEGEVEALRRSRLAILNQAKDDEAVETELRKLAEDFPESPSYRLELAKLYAAQGRLDEAQVEIAELIARDPDNAAWRIQLAGLLFTQESAADAYSSLNEAIENSPESDVLRLALASLYEADDRIDDALSVYELIAQTNPRTAEGLAARNRMASLNIGRDDARARQIVKEILADVPGNVDALLFRATFSAADNQLNEAIADVRSALARQPDSQRGRLMLARFYLLNGNLDLAENAYRDVIVSDPSNRAARNELASLIGNRGDAERAAEILRETLQIAPGDLGASRNFVKAMLVQQNFTAAENEARRMIDLGDTSGAADFQLGLALQAQNEDDRAIAAYEEATQKNPGAIEPLTNLVQLLVKVGRTEEAESKLKGYIEAYPESVPARLLLGDLYRSDGRVDQARAVFRETIAQLPQAAGAYIGLAATLPTNSDEQIQVLADGLQNNPGDLQLGLALGSAYKQREDYEQAIQAYESVIQVNGGNDIIVNNLAVLLLDFRTDQESHARALELVSRFETSATHPFNLGVLGWAYYRNGQSVPAVRHLERAVAAAGDNPKLRYYLGMAYLQSGDTVGARRELENSVETTKAAGGWFEGYDEAVAELQALQAGDL